MAADTAVLTAKTDGFRQLNFWGVHGSSDCQTLLI
jgi:lipid II:glycine glycyltransferase (peptidoglycan interpeptide bridge formation enzyme)